MSEIPENAGKNQETRNEKGQFLPGVSGNPAGKPPGTRHMSTLLEEAIKRVAEDTGTAEDVQIVAALIKKAKTGDIQAIREIWDRIEGKAPQSLDLTTGGEKLQVQVITYTPNANDNDTPQLPA